MDIIKKLAKIPRQVKSAAAYTFATLFTRGLAIITVPIFTRIMSTDQIGIVNLYNSWFGLISVVATLSLTSGGYMLAMKEYENERDQYEASVLSLTSLITIIIMGIYFIAPSYWQNILGLPRNLLRLMLFGLLVSPAQDFWLARQRYEYRYKLSCITTIGTALIASLLSIYAVYYAGKNQLENIAHWRLYANFIIVYGVAFCFWVYIFFKGKTLYNKKYWKFSLSLSIPLVGYSIASQILNVSDRMMISRMVNNSAVGIYSTLYSVSSISTLFWTAIHSSMVPHIFQTIEKKTNSIKKISSILLTLYAIIAILMILLAPEIVKILATKEYYEAIYIMPPIAAGIFFIAVFNLYSDIAVYFKKTKYIMYPGVAAAIINLILNYIFIKLLGYMAAAYTTLISYMLLALFQGIIAQKLERENNLKQSIYDNRYIVLLSAVTTIISLLGIFLYGNIILRYITILILFIFIVCILWHYYKLKKNIN